MPVEIWLSFGAVFAQRMQLVRVVEEEELSIPPPLLAELAVNVQLVSAEEEEEESHIPPPEAAALAVNVQLLSVGEDE